MSSSAWARRMSTRASHLHDFHLSGGIASPNEAQIPSSLLVQDAGVPAHLGNETVSSVIAAYLSTQAFQGLSTKSKKLYLAYLETIRGRFGDWPIKTFEERGARTAIRRWRDEILYVQLRTADATVAMLRLLLNFAVEEEYIYRNPASRLGRVHTTTRRDIIWTEAQIATFLRSAPRHLAWAMLLALWTGQRQSDLLALRWADYDGQYIKLQQKKAYRGSVGRRVKIPVSKELRLVLEDIRVAQSARAQHAIATKRVPLPDTILTTFRGYPWQKGFKAAWRKAVAGCGISGVTFHDLRGTFITLAHRAGASIREIAEASGHDESECERLIRLHYLATGADQVISKLASKHSFASAEWWNKAQ